MWGFLQEFWDAITAVGETSVEWFQNIGLAVSGAIGGAFDWLLHYINDFFIFLGWLFAGLRAIYSIFIAPMSFFANFLNNFWAGVSQSPIVIDSSLNVSSSGANAIFSLIPAWGTMGYILGICLIVVGSFGIIFLLMRI